MAYKKEKRNDDILPQAGRNPFSDLISSYMHGTKFTNKHRWDTEYTTVPGETVFDYKYGLTKSEAEVLFSQGWVTERAYYLNDIYKYENLRYDVKKSRKLPDYKEGETVYGEDKFGEQALTGAEYTEQYLSGVLPSEEYDMLYPSESLLDSQTRDAEELFFQSEWDSIRDPMLSPWDYEASFAGGNVRPGMYAQFYLGTSFFLPQGYRLDLQMSDALRRIPRFKGYCVIILDPDLGFWKYLGAEFFADVLASQWHRTLWRLDAHLQFPTIAFLRSLNGTRIPSGEIYLAPFDLRDLDFWNMTALQGRLWVANIYEDLPQEFQRV